MRMPFAIAPRQEATSKRPVRDAAPVGRFRRVWWCGFQGGLSRRDGKTMATWMTTYCWIGLAGLPWVFTLGVGLAVIRRAGREWDQTKYLERGPRVMAGLRSSKAGGDCRTTHKLRCHEAPVIESLKGADCGGFTVVRSPRV